MITPKKYYHMFLSNFKLFINMIFFTYILLYIFKLFLFRTILISDYQLLCSSHSWIIYSVFEISYELNIKQKCKFICHLFTNQDVIHIRNCTKFVFWVFFFTKNWMMKYKNVIWIKLPNTLILFCGYKIYMRLMMQILRYDVFYRY